MSGKYLNAIKTQIRDLLHSSSLTSGRLILASSATYSAKIGLSIAVRYSLIRRAFSLTPNGPEDGIFCNCRHRIHNSWVIGT
ncbi:acyl-coenzyme A oxidase 3, peroxisomal-like [Apium graveolens]|uniref:acyl-coenzyme A oxidase 3, peroxisomal-like n=1 Tax=Apium graveolens TaxID=4045 RepID=UPI003D7AD2B3